MKPGQALSGFLFGIGGMAALASMDAFAKALSASIPVLEILFVRYAGAAIWLTLFLLIARKSWPKRQNFGRHIIRGAMMALTAGLFFYGVSFLPLAIAMALAMSAPIYVSILGIIFLKEKATKSLFMSIAAGVAGSLIIIFGGDAAITGNSIGFFAWGAAVLAPVSYAATTIVVKHHSKDEDSVAMTLAQSVAAAIITLPLALPGFVVPDISIWPQIAAIGLFGALGFLFFVLGIKRLPASVFATVDYTALLWGAILGYVFFDEAIEPRLWIGGGLIIAACMIGVRAARKTSMAANIA